MMKLMVLPGGGLDLALDNPADPNGAAATVIYALLLTDARAPAEREADAFVAGGWWANPAAGSGLWHVRRQGLSAAAGLETVRMVERALAREPALTDVVVSDDAGAGGLVGGAGAGAGAGAGNVSELRLVVSGKHNGREFLINLSL